MDDVIKSKPIKRWDMAKDMISKLMKTLSENDRIQIILFDEEIERLDDSALLIKATPDAVEALQSKLEDKMPVYSERGLVDFGKAFDKALEAASNAVRSGSSCKTVSPSTSFAPNVFCSISSCLQTVETALPLPWNPVLPKNTLDLKENSSHKISNILWSTSRF